MLFQAGAFRSALLPRLEEDGTVAGYVLIDPPLGGYPPQLTLTFEQSADGRPQIVLDGAGRPRRRGPGVQVRSCRGNRHANAADLVMTRFANAVAAASPGVGDGWEGKPTTRCSGARPSSPSQWRGGAPARSPATWKPPGHASPTRCDGGSRKTSLAWPTARVPCTTPSAKSTSLGTFDAPAHHGHAPVLRTSVSRTSSPRHRLGISPSGTLSGPVLLRDLIVTARR